MCVCVGAIVICTYLPSVYTSAIIIISIYCANEEVCPLNVVNNNARSVGRFFCRAILNCDRTTITNVPTMMTQDWLVNRECRYQVYFTFISGLCQSDAVSYTLAYIASLTRRKNACAPPRPGYSSTS